MSLFIPYLSVFCSFYDNLYFPCFFKKIVFYDWLPRWLFIGSDLTTFFDITGRFPYTGELDTLYYIEQWWTFKVVNMVWYWPDKLILTEVKLRSILVFHRMLCNWLLPWYRWWIGYKERSLTLWLKTPHLMLTGILLCSLFVMVTWLCKYRQSNQKYLLNKLIFINIDLTWHTDEL